MLPNMPEAIIAMLASASLGAVWSSCSPDFGVDGALDRLARWRPRVGLVPDGYYYNGKRVAVADKVAAIAAGLDAPQVVVVNYTGDGGVAALAGVVSWAAWLAPSPRRRPRTRAVQSPAVHPVFQRHHRYKPKCIVHGAGGTLLQHLKEHRLHADLRPGDRFLLHHLRLDDVELAGQRPGQGATLLLFDGSPFAQGWPTDRGTGSPERSAHFGTSAKYLDAAAKQGFGAGAQPWRALRAIFSTGSPLVAEGFDYVYRDIKADVQLSSISGGTDIVSCFALGSPVLPVYRGELQCRGLGMAVDIWNNRPAGARRKGELVCTAPSPACRLASGTTRTAANTTTPYLPALPMSGAMAILPS